MTEILPASENFDGKQLTEKDVYKRQAERRMPMTRVRHLLNYAGQGGTEQYIRTLLQAMEGQEVQAELACNEAGPLAQWAEAVSYTHLDVYKRQPARRCGTGPRTPGGSGG